MTFSIKRWVFVYSALQLLINWSLHRGRHCGELAISRGLTWHLKRSMENVIAIKSNKGPWIENTKCILELNKTNYGSLCSEMCESNTGATTLANIIKKHITVKFNRQYGSRHSYDWLIFWFSDTLCSWVWSSLLDESLYTLKI